MMTSSSKRLRTCTCTLLLGTVVAVVAPTARAQGCDSGRYRVTWFGTNEKCWSNWPWLENVHTCRLGQDYSCGSGQPLGEPFCTFDDGNGSGCAVSETCCGYWPAWPECTEDYCSSTSMSQCTMLGGPEVCGDGTDNNYDGCIDENCTKGVGLCSCTARCSPTGTCQAPAVATCSPFQASQPERCGDGLDNNCNGLVDEGCAPKAANSCGGVAGKDPILLFTRSAVSEPFTDFEAESVVRLGITRTYTSADASLHGGRVGIFGRGWHHDWEATLTCTGEYCVIARGIQGGFTFKPSGIAASLDGLETWDIYARGDTEVLQASAGNGVLVRRPSGRWTYFAPDGSELHFATVCDTCGGSEPTCLDPRQGGIARLVEAYDPKGNRTHVNYDRPSGLLLGLSDDLGHALEVRTGGTSGCYDPLARELRYDSSLVATYSYIEDDLERALDADGSVLRRYFYFPGGYLQAVVNESGAAIAEFAYDANGDAVGLIDSGSDLSVAYTVTSAGHVLSQVTERFEQTSAVSTRDLDQDGNVVSVSGECSCGPSRTTTWRDRVPECIDDGTGSFTYRSADGQGRVVYTATYAKSYDATCPPRSSPTGDWRQEWYGHGLEKQIAVGVSMPLSAVTSTSHATGVVNEFVGEAVDYDPSPNPAIDPPGYECALTPLPIGSVACRRISSGFVYSYNGTRVLERHATFYSYDARGRVIRKYGPVKLENQSAEDVPPIEERTYWGDEETLARRGRLHEIKRYPNPTSAPLVTTIDYDAFGPYAVTDPAGSTMLLIKDARGRVRYTARQDGATETRYYDGNAPRLRLSPAGAVVRTGYDARGRPNLVEYLDEDPDAPGATPKVAWAEHTTYDAAGNATHVERRDTSGAVTWTQDRHFDAQHHVLGEPHPEAPGATKAWSYDVGGILSAVSDEAARTTTFVPDGWGRIRSVSRSGTNPSGGTVSATVASYAYEPWRGTLQSVQDGKAASTTYLHDDFGRLAQLRTDTFNDSTGYFFFSYDARGNLVERRSKSQTLRYTYDGLDRVTSTLAQECGGTDVTCTRSNTTVPRVAYEYRYDENGSAGRLTSILDETRTVAFGYDAAGRLSEERLEDVGLAAIVTSYGYDPDGLVSRISYPSGLALAVERDGATRNVRKLSSLDGTQTYVDVVERWPAGPLRSFRFGNGETYSANVNRRYEPRSIRSGPLAVDYTATAAGDVDSVVEGLGTTRYGYDFLDRLVSASPGVQGEELVHLYTQGAYYPWTKTDRIKASGVYVGSGFEQRYAYGYDRQTNLSAIGAYSAGRSAWSVCLNHDALGRLVTFGPSIYATYSDQIGCVADSDLAAVTARFHYDAQNRRIARWNATTGEWTHFVHGPGGELLSELRKTGDPANPWAPVRDYVWLDGRPVAQIEYQGTTSRTYYIHADHLGTPRVLTSPDRSVVWSAVVQPYGEVAEATTPDPATGRTVVTNLRLPGQYDERLLGSVGLQGPYYNWNRWYLPGVGRYLELDPIGLAGKFNTKYGIDWYAYALGNPLRHVDPRGLSVPPEIIGELAGQILEWILSDYGFDATTGGLLGEVCASVLCKDPSGNPSQELNTCLLLMDRVTIAGQPLSHQGNAPALLQSCSSKCSEIVTSSNWRKKCRGEKCSAN